MSYFAESYPHNRNKIKVELYLSNYVGKSGSKNVAGVVTSKLTKNVYLADLKSDIDKL